MTIEEALAIVVYTDGHAPHKIMQDPEYQEAWRLIKRKAEETIEQREQENTK